MKTFDPTKPVQTRDGRAARIICTDRTGEPFTIVALIKGQAGEEIVLCYTKNGELGTDYADCPANLVNVTDKKEGWINIYAAPNDKLRHLSAWIWSSKEEALEAAGTAEPLATIKVEWPE